MIPLSSGTYTHNKTRDLIGHLLSLCFRENRIGEAVCENDCQIASNEVRCPDVSRFLNDRLDRIDPDSIPAPFAPDIRVLQATDVLESPLLPGFRAEVAEIVGNA